MSLAYYKMIPKIKGAHYRISGKQSNEMLKHYQVDGIPFYFLVTKNGKVTPRPDFRDHDVMVQTLKSACE